MGTWSDTVEPTAKKFDLAAKFNASVQSDATACAWIALALRDMARFLDAARRESGRRLGSVRLFGLKFTVSRDG